MHLRAISFSLSFSLSLFLLPERVARVALGTAFGKETETDPRRALSLSLSLRSCEHFRKRERMKTQPFVHNNNNNNNNNSTHLATKSNSG